MASDEPGPSHSPAPPTEHRLEDLEAEKQFILKFEALPELWNPKHPDYTNKYKRLVKLSELLPILQRIKPSAALTDVKRKINTIRSNHKREFNKVLASNCDGRPLHIPKIWYYPYLHFLRKLQNVDYIESAVTQEEIDKLQTQSTSSYEYLKIQGESSDNGLERTPVKPGLKIKKGKVEKRSWDSSDDSTNQYTSPQAQDSPCVHTCQRMKISNMALEWSETLDRLDPLQRLFAKKAINDVLFEAELGNLHKESVKINETFQYYPCKTTLSNNDSNPMSPTPSNEDCKMLQIGSE